MAMWIKGSNNLLDIPEKFTWTGYLAIPKILSAGTYTMSFNIFVAGDDKQPIIIIQNMDSHTAEVSFNTISGNLKTFTLVGGNYEFRFYSSYSWADSQGVTSTINKLMLNKGETALPYEPYYPAQRVKAVFKSKNLFNVKSLTFNWNNKYVTVNPDGSLTVNAYNVGSKESLLHYVPDLKANNTYTLSLQMDSDSPYIYLYGTKRIWRSGQSLVLTQADLDGNFNFYGSNSIYTTPLPTPTTIWDIMINEGETALPYEPYLPLTKFKAIPKSRNLFHLPFPNPIKVENGVTFTDMGDGGIKIQGTATGNAVCGILRDIEFTGYFHSLVNGTPANKDGYWLSVKSNELPENYKHIIVAFERYNAANSNNGYFYILCDKGKTYDCIVYPMLNKGDPLPYEPPQEIWL